MPPTHLDLFSGIGGFALAAAQAGFETIGFCEIDKFCDKVLKKYWPAVINYGDIKQLNYATHVDLITGGFPCQPFSIAGNKKGKKDERYLWPEFLRIIRQSRPAWVVAENVKGLLEMGLDNILDDLETEGYNTQAYLIPACAVGAPHKRERLWIIAHNSNNRRERGADNRERGHLQDNKKWDISALQSHWAQLKPKHWETYKSSDWLQFNAGISRKHDGVPGRVDRHRIKALGNAIVPQVAFPILASIFSLID